MDPAPYSLNGRTFGYAMLQFRVKKKSGHSTPKKGGDLQPITSHSMTHRLARTSFMSALLWTLMIGTICIQMSAREMWRERFCIYKASEDDMPVSSSIEMEETDSSRSEEVQMYSTRAYVPKICEPKLRASDTDDMEHLMSDVSRLESSTSHFENDAPRVFTMWIKPFHINLGRYLPAYLQWRKHIDDTVLPSKYPDEQHGEFIVQTMVPWRL